MPSTAPQLVWSATPDKTNHKTKGYTSKVIFNFQCTTPIAVSDSTDILDTIISSTFNYKGSNILNSNYFLNCDGRAFRITMYFLKNLDGDNMNISQELYDINETTNYIITEPTPTITSAIGGDTLAKYECDITTFLDASTGSYFIQGLGNIVYANSLDGTNVVMTPFRGNGVYIGLVSNRNSIRILNKCGDDIQILSLIIEEVS
jgi:hypothetical protein